MPGQIFRLKEGLMSLVVTVTERHEGSYLITLEGRLDSNTYFEFEDKIHPVLTSSPRLLIFDLEKLDYISSMGIKSIVTARKAIEARDGHLVLINLQPQIRKVFEIVAALPREAVFASVEDADQYFDMVQKQELEKLKP
jgi:anti-sigma B factor antagonist